MFKSIGKSFLVLLLFVAHSTNSNAILVDEGDTTLQSSAGLEWLDLNFSAMYTINDILNGAGGYIDAGWEFANFSQVSSLYLEAGAAPSFSGLMVTNTDTILAAQRLNSLLGTLSPSVTFGQDPTVFYGSTAFAMSDDGSFASQILYQVAEDASKARLWNTSNSYQWTPDQWNGINNNIGNYLVRSVPEPSTLFLFLIGLLGVFAVIKVKGHFKEQLTIR